MMLAVVSVPVVVALAAAAVAGPVLVHLLFRQRFRPIDWAAGRFLLAARKKQHRRIDRWVLLACRVLASVLPVAAIAAAAPWAEPLWQAVTPGRPETISNAPRTHYVLVLDASASMTAEPGGAARFEAAVGHAERLVRAANPGDAFTVLALGSRPTAVVPGPSSDADKVVAELRELAVAHAASDLPAGLTAVADVVARSPRNYPRRQVLLFTDMQRAGWFGLLPKNDSPPADVWQRIAARADIGVIDVSAGAVDNLAVVGVALADPLPLAGEAAVVTAAVQNFGRSERRQVRVELRLARPPTGAADPGPLPVETRVIDAIAAGERATVSFALDGPTRFRQAGSHVVQVKLAEPDDMPVDDARAVAVEVRDGLKCVIVNGTPSADPFRRASEYLAEALAPGGSPTPGNPARPRVVDPDAFADPALSDLSDADCVFLCDVPNLTPAQVARLDAVLKRGGGVVIGMGPNVAADIDRYNRLLFRDGDGLLPGKLLGVAAADDGYRLAADEAAYREPPLAAFQDDNARGGLTAVPFKKYVRIDAPAGGRGRRVLSFAPAGGGGTGKPDPAVVELRRHRGRVVVYASAFHRDWTDWPVLPSFLPFAHETLRFAAASPGRFTLRADDVIEEFGPVTNAGLTATLTLPTGDTRSATAAAADEGSVVRFADTPRAGLYTLAVGSGKPRYYAVNPPDALAGGGSESDLRLVSADEVRAIHPSIQVATDPTALALRDGDGALFVTTPKPHGPTLARYLVSAAVVALGFELWLAWRLGPARAAINLRPDADQSAGAGGWPRAVGWGLLAAAGVLLFAVAHAATTGELLGFLPDAWRRSVESSFGVPAAGPGEGTRWRLESQPAFARSVRADQWATLGIAAALAAGTAYLYRLERRAVRPGRRLVLPAALRLAAYGVVLFVLLPQLRLAFDREGWPDVAVIVDTSASMDTADAPADPAVRAKADELAKVVGDQRTRLRLAQALLTRPDGGWLTSLLTDRQFKVHVYAVADGLRPVATVTEAEELNAAADSVKALAADGESSRLGDGVQGVLKAFRGGSLAGIILLTDGVTTAGDDLPTAARAAARAGVPVYPVGLGDARDPLDLGVGDLRADDVVPAGDELAFDLRLTARGAAVPRAVTVTLSERVAGKLVARDQTTVAPDPAGKPVPVRLRHVPADTGEKTYVIEVPPLAGEADTANNRLERQVVVTDNKQLRVLLIDGRPRYEFRFVKVLLERELEATKGTRSIALRTLLLDAGREHHTTDRTALRGFPTRDELFEYDVVVLGDVDPKLLPQPNQTLQNLADFVRIRGGGLLVQAGEQANPHLLFATPLADVLPVAAAGAAPKPLDEADPVADGYRPKLTPGGLLHSVFRLAATDAESGRVWNRLSPLMWSAAGYRRKPAAEVLATHPTRPADDAPGEPHPLAVQQFVGAGRVLFLGFDDTWRWRFRGDEELFNRFWRQAVRVLSRNRVSRPEVRTDKQTAYRRGEPITLTVRFPDDAPPPDGPVRLTAERNPLKKPDGTPGPGDSESQTLALAKVEGSRATYQATLARTADGAYTFRLASPEVPGTKPKAEATVLPPPGERDRLEMNRPDLERAAAESRGKFYTLTDADALLDELPDAARLPLNQPCPPVSVWDHPAVYLLALALLCGEWVLRKRERLV